MNTDRPSTAELINGWTKFGIDWRIKGQVDFYLIRELKNKALTRSVNLIHNQITTPLVFEVQEQL